MNFLSRQFAILFAMQCLFLLVIRPPAARKVSVLIVSAIFYGWADWRFLFLLSTVTVVDYGVARVLAREVRIPARRALLGLSVTLNLGFLFAFKYSHFAAVIAARIAQHPDPVWSLALPIGISFYTFETLSYVIDVYRREATPTESLLDYAVFVSFFPRLIAGPITRAHQFLPQLAGGLRVTPEGFASGAQLFAIGAFKKMVVADNLAIFVDRVYQNPYSFTPATVWAAVFSYSIQVYCDFAAYTDMARGAARALGIDLPPNFRLPYTSQSITEFWQRWHITLSSWLRDYLYIPLGGNRKGTFNTYRNLILTMVLGGLWHGANWTFVVFGAVQGLLLTLERMLAGGRKIEPAPWNRPSAWLRAIACFVTFSVSLVLFRGTDLHTIEGMFRKLAFLDESGIYWIYWSAPLFVSTFWIGGFIVRRFPLRPWPLAWSNPLLPAFLMFIVLSVFLFMPVTISPFIYFRF